MSEWYYIGRTYVFCVVCRNYFCSVLTYMYLLQTEYLLTKRQLRQLWAVTSESQRVNFINRYFVNRHAFIVLTLLAACASWTAHVARTCSLSPSSPSAILSLLSCSFSCQIFISFFPTRTFWLSLHCVFLHVTLGVLANPRVRACMPV